MELDVDDFDNVREVTAIIADGVMDYYEGTKYGGVVGMFSWPYYWWHAGGVFGGLIDYGFIMQNDTWDEIVKEALLHQTGDDNNFIPLNQSTTEGNDDQGFWGLAVMTAVERNFTNPEDPEKAWLALTQAVFNTMSVRWDESSCNGGLRWQIFQWNSGYDYKNSVSNGCLFNIGARLARYTRNDSYIFWCERVWDWMYGSGFLTEDTFWLVYDGANIEDNCSEITRLVWSYNQGLFLSGCAFLYNYTEDPKWLERTENLLVSARTVFFRNDIMFEAACQPGNNCNQDQRSFKAYFSRFLGHVAVMAPSTYDTVMSLLRTSAVAAAGQCSGSWDGHTCGLNWFNSTYDGYWGLGEQLSALEVIVNTRVGQVDPPYTSENGGSSQGNPAAGFGTTLTTASPLTLGTKDRAGAGVITALIGVSIIASCVWLVL